MHLVATRKPWSPPASAGMHAHESTKTWYRNRMGTNTSISLDDHFAAFLAREVATGRYRSASEVVRAGLRLLEDHETQMSALRAALVAGEESGQAAPFNFDEFVAEKKS
jgi:antitoxin ParD1/3/4